MAKLTTIISLEGFSVGDDTNTPRNRVLYNPICDEFFKVEANWPYGRKLYEWLIENVGEEICVFRKYDRISFDFYDIETLNKQLRSKEITFNEVNPPVDLSRRNWYFVGMDVRSIHFRDPAHAVLFKMTWL